MYMFFWNSLFEHRCINGQHIKYVRWSSVMNIYSLLPLIISMQLNKTISSTQSMILPTVIIRIKSPEVDLLCYEFLSHLSRAAMKILAFVDVKCAMMNLFSGEKNDATGERYNQKVRWKLEVWTSTKTLQKHTCSFDWLATCRLISITWKERVKHIVRLLFIWIDEENIPALRLHLEVQERRTLWRAFSAILNLTNPGS